MGAKLNRKIDNFTQAARLERLTSPDIIQKTKAVRHPSSAITRKAFVKNDAGAAATITCYLNEDWYGEGDEPATITVNCNISGTPKELNSCTRKLEDGDMLIVTKIGGSWYAAEGFQAYEECVCTPV